MKKCNSTSSFLREAIKILKKESPAVHRRMVVELKQTTTSFKVGDEQLQLAVINDELEVSAGNGRKKAKAEGTISVEGLLQLVDGTATIPVLLQTEELTVKAAPDTLLKLDTVVKLFLESALKSVSLQSHFEEYRRWAQAHG